MISVRVVRVGEDADLSSQLQLDLVARGFYVSASEPWALVEDEASVGASNYLPILLFPQERPTAANYELTLKALEGLVKGQESALLLARSDDTLPDWIARDRVEVVRTTGLGGYDKLFEDVLRYLLGPLPPAVELVARPSLLQSPAGVTWWLQDLWVSDDAFGHVARISARSAGVALPGLDSPQQLHLDKTKLLVTNKDADLIVRADVTPAGALSEIKRLIQDESYLRRPDAVHQAGGNTLIADIDNHRVLVTCEDPWWREVSWRELEADRALHFPCGVCVGAGHWWVADTYNRRILATPRNTVEGKLSPVELNGIDVPIFPVAMTVSVGGELLIVSDEYRKCVIFFRIESDGEDEHPRLTRVLEFGSKVAPGGGGAVPVGTPGGLSVNRDNRLAVADRQLACVWLIHLDAYAEDLAA